MSTATGSRSGSRSGSRIESGSRKKSGSRNDDAHDPQHARVISKPKSHVRSLNLPFLMKNQKSRVDFQILTNSPFIEFLKFFMQIAILEILSVDFDRPRKPDIGTGISLSEVNLEERIRSR